MCGPKSLADETSVYSVTFLTDQWEWDAALSAETLAQAKLAAREALEAVIREERPELACVYLFKCRQRIGVWDWVERQFHWTHLPGDRSGTV